MGKQNRGSQLKTVDPQTYWYRYQDKVQKTLEISLKTPDHHSRIARYLHASAKQLKLLLDQYTSNTPPNIKGTHDNRQALTLYGLIEKRILIDFIIHYYKCAIIELEKDQSKHPNSIKKYCQRVKEYRDFQQETIQDISKLLNTKTSIEEYHKQIIQLQMNPSKPKQRRIAELYLLIISQLCVSQRPGKIDQKYYCFIAQIRIYADKAISALKKINQITQKRENIEHDQALKQDEMTEKDKINLARWQTTWSNYSEFETEVKEIALLPKLSEPKIYFPRHRAFLRMLVVPGLMIEFHTEPDPSQKIKILDFIKKSYLTTQADLNKLENKERLDLDKITELTQMIGQIDQFTSKFKEDHSPGRPRSSSFRHSPHLFTKPQDNRTQSTYNLPRIS